MAYALMPLFSAQPAGGSRLPLTPLQMSVAVAVGCGWTICGGIGHLVFANADWHIRDAVLHDLVTSRWPVGYGVFDGKESLLRAPVGYFLPAALMGKLAGLKVAHLAMGLWTAAGATLLLLQVLSLTPSRAGTAMIAAAVVVLFSGFDIIGSLLNDGPHFRANWSIASHLEWWEGSYQYSSMTTQLFWVPNHALGGWLSIGLLYRDKRGTPLDSMLPIITVAIALWSPLTALGLVPFVLFRAYSSMTREHSLRLMHPRVWAPALAVGTLVVAAYLVLDLSRIPEGLAMSGEGPFATMMALLRQAQFFLLEAGFIGLAVLTIRRSSQIVIALVILALLPLFVHFGPANDLVMRASIPSIAVLAIEAGLALSRESVDSGLFRKKILLGSMLVVGAVTPIQEFARALTLPPWPINLQATLIGAACGKFPAHYVARLDGGPIVRLLRKPQPISRAQPAPQACDNPAIDEMWDRGLLR